MLRLRTKTGLTQAELTLETLERPATAVDSELVVGVGENLSGNPGIADWSRTATPWFVAQAEPLPGTRLTLTFRGGARQSAGLETRPGVLPVAPAQCPPGPNGTRLPADRESRRSGHR